MITEAIKAAKAWAELQYPKEACGLIAAGAFWPCENSADNPLEDFAISGEEWARVEDSTEDVTHVIHSHPDQRATPSESDKLSCEALGLPWIIIEVREGVAAAEVHHMDPSGYVAPLIGRQFKHGVHDCLSIVLDYYKREMGVDLGEYDRNDDWWNNGQDHYRELLPKAGFRRIEMEDLGQGDVILMQIRSPVPNHAAVFLQDGIISTEPDHYPSPGCILHHMHGRDSKRDPYGGYWRENTVSVWRYERAAKDS